MDELHPGVVAWTWLDPAVGREQSGRRPVVVVSSEGYLDVVTSLVVVVPVTRTDRGWPNHVPITGLPDLPTCFAMSEQPRAVSRDRVGNVVGRVENECLQRIRRWLADFLELHA